MSEKLQVWSCGGGTQSCAIGALIVQGKLPKPDFSVIANTGRETEATWEYLDKVLRPQLSGVGHQIWIIEAKDWGWFGNDPVLNQKRKAGIRIQLPVYTTDNGFGKMPALCSGAWKAEPIKNWLRRVHKLSKRHYTRWIGFSRDEQRRILRMQQGEDFKRGLIRFPLVELGLTRQDCIKLVESMGWGTPPRSACWMCPNHSDHEWRKLIAERPDEFQKAVELERQIRAVDPDAWLHRSCVPLDQVDFSQPEDLFSRPCDSGMCFV